MKNTVDGKLYAVKHVRLAALTKYDVTLDMVMQEYPVLGGLRHTNIARQLLTFPASDKHGLTVVAEYIVGVTLATSIAAADAPLAQQILLWARQMASALAYMHNEGVLHRDLNPENVLLTSSGAIKLVGMKVPSLADVTGTVSVYTSYERASGQLYDGRDDVWALGCILSELLTRSRIKFVLLCRPSESARRAELIETATRSDAYLGTAILPQLLVTLPAERSTAQALLDALTAPSNATHRAETDRPIATTFATHEGMGVKQEIPGTLTASNKHNHVSADSPMMFSESPSSADECESDRKRNKTSAEPGPAVTGQKRRMDFSDCSGSDEDSDGDGDFDGDSDGDSGGDSADEFGCPMCGYGTNDTDRSGGIDAHSDVGHPGQVHVAHWSSIDDHLQALQSAADSPDRGNAAAALHAFLTRDRYKAPCIAFKGGAELWCELLNGQSEQAMVLGARALQELVYHDAACADSAVSAQALQRLIQMLETTAKGAAAQALAVILRSSSRQISTAVGAGVIRPIVRLLKAEDATGKAHAAAVVEAIARVASHGPALVAADMLTLLVCTVRTGGRVARKHAAAALTSLARHAQTQAAFLQASVIPQVVQILVRECQEETNLQHPDDPRATSKMECAAQLVRQCVEDGKLRKAVVSAGAVEPLVRLLSCGSLDALEALRRIAEDPNNAGRLIAAAAVPALAMMLVDCSDAVEVKDSVCRIFTILGHGTNGTAAGRSVCPVTLLTRMLLVKDDALKVQAATALVTRFSSEADRDTIAAAGAVPLFVQLMNGSAPPVKEAAANALAAQTIGVNGRQATVDAGAIPVLARILAEDSANCKEQAAAVFKCLAIGRAEIKAAIIAAEGVIPSLVSMLTSGTPMGMVYASAALAELAVQARKQIVDAGGILGFIQLLIVKGLPGTQAHAACALGKLGAVQPFRRTIVEAGAIPLLEGVIAKSRSKDELQRLPGGVDALAVLKRG